MLENFQDVWITSSQKLFKLGIKTSFSKQMFKPGHPHPVFELTQKLRELFLRFGFDEVINTYIIEDTDMYKQYGAEAPAILDRCYYLAVIPRPDIGISKEKIDRLKNIVPTVTTKEINGLKEVFHSYKKGKISSDDLVGEIASILNVNEAMALEVFDNVFPEFKELKPEPTKLILRSHMTSSWFHTISALQYKLPLPIKLFSVDIRFRREQREDEKHLSTHRVASCVIVDEALSIDEALSFTKAFLKELGFIDVYFIKKSSTPAYYAPNSNYEVFIKHKGNDIEVAELGLYNPISLAKYDIVYPVINIGFGVERIAMVIYNEQDIRRLVYPQFYGIWVLTDEDIASTISLDKIPSTVDSWLIFDRLIETSKDNKDTQSPCTIRAYEGPFMKKHIIIEFYENDPSVKLLGPAAFNRIYVYKGNILAIPEEGFENIEYINEARTNGVKTNIRFIDAAICLFLYQLEQAILIGAEEVNLRIKMVKQPSDINIRIPQNIYHYITSRNLKIDIKGPAFIGIYARIMK
ncbi:MAG: O-phosphoserine--tRNA ligase [Candidatus Methanomethylicia archaeon]